MRPGFSDPVHQSQQVFRQVLEATARPGTVHTLRQLPLAAPGLSNAATAVCLSLADFETPLWLDRTAFMARDYLAFHCSAPITDDRRHATFSVIGNARELDTFEHFKLGSDENPEIAGTLIIEVAELGGDDGQLLAGPGIRERTRLHVGGVAAGFWQQVADNHALFPRGVDLILSCGTRIAGLPRSVRVLSEG